MDYNHNTMPQKSKFKLPAIETGEESLGQRIARIRKKKGYTQSELAKKIGIIQALISEYERDKIRPHYEMIIRFALALEVTTDELLGLKAKKGSGKEPSLKIIKRMNKIEALPPSQQKTLLQTIDMFLKATER